MYEHLIPPSLSPQLRVGDAERERTADRLRNAHTEGRIDVQEFQERLDRCYQAKMAGDLSALVNDLPRDPRERGFGGGGPHFGFGMFPIVPIVMTILLISLVGSFTAHAHWGVLWLIVPMFFLARRWIRRRRSFGSGWPGNGPQV